MKYKSLNLKVRDRVIDEDYGKGTVISIKRPDCPDYPIIIEFDSENDQVGYTREGSSIKGTPPTLKKIEK